MLPPLIIQHKELLLLIEYLINLPGGHFSHSILSLVILPVLSTLKYSRMALGLFLCLWPIFLGLV